MKYLKKTLLILFLFLSLFSCKKKSNSFSSESPFVIISGVKFEIEIADTQETRARGLMFRESLPEKNGMLFVYDKKQTLNFWMKNTQIPLSIAFIDEQGFITDILDMQPFDESSHRSSCDVKYALELNQGEFQKHKISVGDKVFFFM